MSVTTPSPEAGSGYPGYAAYAAPEGMTIAGVLGFVRRRLRVILAAGSAVSTAAAAFILLQPAPYEATALVLIGGSEQRVVNPEQSFSALALSTAAVDAEVEALNTREIALRLTEKLDLRKDPEFNSLLRASGTPNQSAPALDKTPDKVLGAIEAQRKGVTNIVEVSARSQDPEKAALLANATVEAYLDSLVDLGVQSAGRADAWLQQRLEELRLEVNTAETAVEQFRVEAGLLAVNGATFSERQGSEVQTALLTAEADLAEAEARRQQVAGLIRSGGSPEAIAAVINSQLIRDLRGREADVARERAELLARYGPKHPSIQDNAAELEDIRAQISSEMTRIAQSLESEVGVARARIANLEQHMAESQDMLRAGNDQLSKLRQLEREAAAARAVYESFLERSHEISEQGGLSANQARLLSAATAPSSDTAPSLLVVVLAAGVLGALAGMIAGLLAEQLDDTLDSADDLERKLGMPAMASIPEMPRKAMRALPLERMHPAQYLVQNPHSAYAEALRVVRAAIIYAPTNAPRKVVAVTSASPGEGKTTLSLSLARLAALSGERVLVVDCDVRRRSLNDLLNIAPSAGLLEVLVGQRHWREVIGRDDEGAAHIMPLSTLAAPLHDLIGSEAMRALLAELAGAYDLVILDCPPVLAVAETRALARMADMTLVVGRRRKTSARALANAIHQIQASGAVVSGVALNGVDPRSPGRTSYSDALYFQEAQKVLDSA